jgi:hypothetical protein
MQAITVALSPAGIEYFVKQVLVDKITSNLTNLTPTNQNFNVGTVNISTYDWYDDVVVNLTNGSLVGFKPTLSSITQQPGGSFLLSFTAKNFNAQYTWQESGTETRMTDQTSVQVPYTPGSFIYDGPVQSLVIAVTVAFQFNASSNSWVVTYTSSTATPSGVSNKIPDQSIVHVLTEGCTQDAAANALSAGLGGINFGTLVSNAIPPLIDTIPDSGKLTPDITYVFGLGDSGLAFPNNQGLAIGATGSVTWNKTAYTGTPPTGLAVPPPPTDGHHMQMYVSDYEFNALYWAFFNDHKLSFTLQPTDLKDPQALKVATYVSMMPSLATWQYNSMEATVTPIAPPTLTFEQVYTVSSAAMTTLQTQLPSAVYGALTDLAARSFAEQASFEAALATVGKASGVNMQPYYATIEAATKGRGAVVTHDIEITLTILNTPLPSPYFSFAVQRADILDDLVLGVSGSAQTLQFDFLELSSSAQFGKTNIPNFDGQDFGKEIWPLIGDTEYTDVLRQMGAKGVALPIMQGFDFLFEQAVISIQISFVSVLANVQFAAARSVAGAG